MKLRIELFGDVRLSLDGRAVQFPAPKIAPLLGYLILHEGRAQPRGTVAAALWPDVADSEARANLRRHLALLQRLLHECGSIAVETEGGSLRWIRHARTEVDVYDFDEFSASIAAAEAAVALYRGDLLERYEDEWIVPIREGYRRRATAVIEKLFEARLAAGNVPEAAAHADRLLKLEPMREDVVRAMMTIRLGDGDRAGALTVYRDFARRLNEEFAAEPMVETTALYDSIRAGAGPRTVHIAQIPTVPVSPSASATSFVGRRREVAELRALLKETPVLSLVGVGGIGKSRLARALTADVADSFMDGARFIELAGLAADESPLQAIARTFGLAPMNPDATQRVLSEYLRQSHSLLTLDNCERHIDACRRAIEDLLRSCPNVRIVTTSRLALGLAGETIYRVSPLSIPLKLDGAASGPEISDAVELFVERARSAGASESADPLERRAVSAICRHFDGVPLAIELAAARRRLLSASQILARLNDRGLVVDYAHAELQPHQRTVSEAIAWTFATLDADSLSVARMLSVMPGSFGLDAAEAAIGRNGAATLDALGILVDASLLTVIQGSHAARYDMLEPVREFARSELSNDAATAAYARLAGFYAARVGDGDTPPGSGSPPAAFEALEAERLNVRAVLEGCARHRVAEKAAAAVANALVAFWQEQGHVIDGAAVHRALLEAFGAGPSQSTLLIGASRFARLSADYAAARSYASSALEAARSQDQVSTQIDALHAIALVDYTVGDLAQARARHAAARDLAARLGDAAREGRAHANLGLIAIQTAEHDAAAQQLGEAVRLLSDGADDRLLAEATSALAYCERFRGNLGESRSFTLRTVTAAYESGNRSLLSTGLSNLAHLAVLQGDYADAVARLSASLELSRTGAYLFTLVHDMEVAARLFYGLGRFREAAIFLFGARSLNKRLSVLRTPQEEAALSEIEATISANLSAVELAEAAIILRDASATRCADEVLERLVPLRKAHQTAP